MTAIPPELMVPGNVYRVTFQRGSKFLHHQSRYIGREVTFEGDYLLLAQEPVGSQPFEIFLPSVRKIAIPSTTAELFQNGNHDNNRLAGTAAEHVSAILTHRFQAQDRVSAAQLVDAQPTTVLLSAPGRALGCLSVVDFGDSVDWY